MKGVFDYRWKLKDAAFTKDYDFGNHSPHYVCGMSVPPVMMAQVAERIYYQWLDKIKSNGRKDLSYK